jgi:hypothetical protein
VVSDQLSSVEPGDDATDGRTGDGSTEARLRQQ